MGTWELSTDPATTPSPMALHGQQRDPARWHWEVISSPSIAQRRIYGYLKTLGSIAMVMQLLDIGLDLQTQSEKEIGSAKGISVDN